MQINPLISVAVNESLVFPRSVLSDYTAASSQSLPKLTGNNKQQFMESFVKHSHMQIYMHKLYSLKLGATFSKSC